MKLVIRLVLDARVVNSTTFVLNPFLVTVYDLSECCVSILVATTEIERPVSGS